MRNIKLATGPVSWGVDFVDVPGNPPWQQVLDAIASSPLNALELGPIGYLPEDSHTLRHELDRRGLTAIGACVFDDLHDPDRARDLDAFARHASSVISGAGGQMLVIIDKPGPERAATAGRAQVARRLDPTEWSSMLQVIESIAATARAHGLTPVVHPHAGGYIEFRDEIERLLSDCELPLCFDTGHAAYAGITPEEAIRAYGERIRYLHLKDIDGTTLARVHDEGLDFWDAIAAGVFCPLGDGVVNLRGVARALDEINYYGFATIEQDRVPGSGTPLDDLGRCLEALGSAGIGRTTQKSALDASR